MHRTAHSTPRFAAWRTVLLALLFALCLGGLAAAQPVVNRPPTFQGTLEDGSLYAIWRPAEWNGDLVIYAHGIVEPFMPVAIPTTQDAFYVYRDAWLDRHFAVAVSSYAENGWALDSAVKSTHQLRGVFHDLSGPPARTFLVGHSLGALAIAKLVEKHGDRYDGAMPMCGMLGGATMQLGYSRDMRLLYDYFFPGVLPGSVFDVPVLSPPQIGAQIQAAAQKAVEGFVTGDPVKQAQTIQWLRTSQAATLPTPLAFGPPYPANVTVASIGVTAGYAAAYSLVFTNDLLGRVENRIPVDNTEKDYVGSFDDVTLNLTIDRYEAEQPGIAYLRRLYDTTGRIRTKVLALHTRWDPAVPATHQTAYAAKVAAAGRADDLVQRIYTAYGHCDPEMFGTAPFDPTYIAATLADFDSLVTWASGGVRPTPMP
jgi:pimeloyl-ACP methyl ester carboxylesterase